MEDPLDLLVHTIRAERAALVRLARHEGVAAEDALDCVHDAFCTYLRMALTDAIPSDVPTGAMLAGVVRNAARNRRRRHHVARPHLPLDEQSLASEGSPEHDLERAEEHIRLHACVDQLCDTQRAVVSLRLLEEQRGEDVAEALGISRAYVDVLLHRAKRALNSCLREA